MFSFNALERAHFESISSEEREHVTFFFWKNKKNNFKISQLKNADDWSDYRFTIDYPEDYKASLLLHDEIETRIASGRYVETNDSRKLKKYKTSEIKFRVSKNTTT